VYLNGYAVQREADKNDQDMTPAGAYSIDLLDSFLLTSSGQLFLVNGTNKTPVASGVASISDQSIDNNGHAMIDVVFKNGVAEEYHVGTGFTWMDQNVKMAKSGQGVSYLLYNDGTVKEYKDWGTGSSSATLTPFDTSGAVVSIDAGTDRYGVNMMTEGWSYDPSYYTYGIENSDSTGWHWLDSGVSTLSAGRQGNIGILYNGGKAVWYNEANNTYQTEGWYVTQFTMGTDESGGAQFDMLYSSGALSQYSQADGWKWTSTYQSIGKSQAGWVEGISSGVAWADFLGANQWRWIGDGVAVVA
jgi:hypothetical protein